MQEGDRRNLGSRISIAGAALGHLQVIDHKEKTQTLRLNQVQSVQQFSSCDQVLSPKTK